MARWNDTQPIQGDSVNDLLSKIAQMLYEGAGSGGGDGVTSLSVNGGPAQTGAVNLPAVTGITVDGGAVQTGNVALTSGPVNFKDENGGLDAAVFVDNGSTEVARWVGTTGTLTTRRLNAQNTVITGINGESGNAPTAADTILSVLGGTGGDSTGFFVNAAAGGSILFRAGDGGANLLAGNGGNGGDVNITAGNGGLAGIFDPPGVAGSINLTPGTGSSGPSGEFHGYINLLGNVNITGILAMPSIQLTDYLSINSAGASGAALQISQDWNGASVLRAAVINANDTASDPNSQVLRLTTGFTPTYTFRKGPTGKFSCYEVSEVFPFEPDNFSRVVMEAPAGNHLIRTEAGGTGTLRTLQVGTGPVVGSDIAGVPTILHGGQSTGTGLAGALRLQVSPAGAAGATVNALVTRIEANETGLGFFATAPVAQQVSGANLTNNVTAGGTDNTIANYTDLTTYATDAAAIRNNIYQLARKLKQVNDALRAYGLLT